MIRTRALAAAAALVTAPAAAHAALVPAGAGLRAPADVRADVYATGLTRPTAFAMDARGGLWATSGAGGVTPQDGVWFVARRGATPRHVVRGIPTPLGLTWSRGALYVAERGRVEAFSRFGGGRFAARRVVVSGLPVGLHQDAGIAAGPDGRIYLGLGSPCDHCVPPRRVSATVLSFRPDGSGLRVVARGLRYAYGLAFVPGTSDLLATENGRDDLGIARPDDELNLIRDGADYGYPGCWHQGGPPCRGVTPPLARFPAHASADGIAVVDGTFPGYGLSAFVALFGSSFTPPTGRSVARVALTRRGDGYAARVSTFATGFDTPLALTTTGTAILVGDFSRGTVYRLRHR